MLQKIPSTLPATPLLDALDAGRSLHDLSLKDLEAVCVELREFLLYTVGQTGGHFGAGLGVVELTVALHHLYNTPHDSCV